MHTNILAIVYAETAEDAMLHAEDAIGSLVSHSVFDSYDVVGPPLLADSVRGIKLISEGMRATKRDFLDALKGIRQSLENETDEELWRCRYDPETFRLNCRRAGAHEGDSIYVYDADGARDN